MNDPFRLVEELRAAGLNVRLYAEWSTTGGNWADGDRPDATMVHHTAPPLPYPLRDLAGLDTGRVKCNINIKQNGDVWLIAYGACNYSSGQGSSIVLDEARRDILPRANARDRLLVDDQGGNAHYWNIEVDHRGDGSPQTLEAELALAAVCSVVGDHFGYPPGRVVTHAEWTARKIDPYWGGTPRAAIERLRALIQRGGEMRGPNGEPNWEHVSRWAQGAWSWGWTEQLLSDDDPTTPADESTHPKDPVDKEELTAILQRFDRRLEKRLEELVEQLSH